MKFIGTKIVTAEAMTRLDYCTLRGWALPADEAPFDPGYLVEYEPDGKPNVPGRAGYVSWTPKAVFDQAYRPCDAMTYGLAIEALRHGHAIARAGWNGKGMFVYLVAPNAYPATSAIAKAYFGDQLVPYNAYMALKGADGRISTWVASISDTLAEDWTLIPAEQLQAALASAPAPIVVDRVDQLQDVLEAVSKHPTKDAEAKADMPAPHVPGERIDALVASLQFKTAHIPGTTTTLAVSMLPGMSNFVVSEGRSSCVSAANFDAEKGVKYAIEAATLTAREKLWEFEGYSLAKDLANRTPNPTTARELAKANLVADGRPPHQVRVFEEKWDLDERLGKLRAFLAAPYFAHLDEAEQGRLKKQADIMLQLSEVLAERIAAF